MKLLVERKYPNPDYTIGAMSIDGVPYCDTLEDAVRKEKIYGKTAIPYGTYKVIMSYSPKFKRVLPEILDVPGFSGVRIHSGNTPEDTEGCILVGKNTETGKVTNSLHYSAHLNVVLQNEKDITITIV